MQGVTSLFVAFALSALGTVDSGQPNFEAIGAIEGVAVNDPRYRAGLSRRCGLLRGECFRGQNTQEPDHDGGETGMALNLGDDGPFRGGSLYLAVTGSERYDRLGAGASSSRRQGIACFG
mgnify:CR=1 FL=1